MRALPAFILCSCLAGAAWAEGFGPWSVDARHPVFEPQSGRLDSVTATGGRHAASPFRLALGVWTNLLTRIDGPRCSHRPSCSAYAHQAIARHGLALGTWMALNRLMRGAHSSALRMLPLVRSAGGIFLLDSLEDSTFWVDDYSVWSGRKK